MFLGGLNIVDMEFAENDVAAVLPCLQNDEIAEGALLGTMLSGTSECTSEFEGEKSISPGVGWLIALTRK